MIVHTDKRRVPFQIDEEDYEAVSRYSWCISDGYARTVVGRGASRLRIAMHLFLLGPAAPGLKWDHESRDKLDNRRGNLRQVTDTVNKQNVGLKSTNTSGVKGVSWDRGTGRWRARIKVDRRQRHIGLFATIGAAAAARLAAERSWS